MKVGVTTFGGDGGKSGISQYIICLLREFARHSNGAQFEVLGYENEESIFLPVSGDMTGHWFSPQLRQPIRNVLWHQTVLPRWSRDRNYDVLFLPAANRRLPLAAPCPTVGTVHDFSSIHVQGKYDPARMFYITRVLPFLVRRLTRVLTVSESSKRDIVEYAGVPDDRIVVTPLAANPDVYHPGDPAQAIASLKTRYRLRPPYILFISRIEHPGKNHARLIRAFAKMKRGSGIPHQLVLAGSDWGRAGEVHREAEASGVSASILFTGFVPAADLPALCRGAEVFVFPSLYEGFGLPILEAMSCKVPVACSNISSMPEVAGDAAVLFDPYEEEAIAGALRTLLEDPAFRDRMAERGFQRSKEFSWSKTAARTMDVIRSAGGLS